MSFVAALGRGALVFAVGAVAYGTAEALVNTAVGLHLPMALWAIVLGVYATIGLLAGGALGLGGRALGREVRVPFLMAAFLSGTVFVHVALPLNDRFLPGLVHPVSLLVNATLAMVVAGVALVPYRSLAAMDGRMRTAAFVAMAFGLGLALAAAVYIDMFVVQAGGVAGTLGVYAGLVGTCVLLLLAARRVFRLFAGGRGWRTAVAGSAAAVVAVGLGLLTRTHPTVAAIPPAAAARPNVLWIVLDTVRPDHLSVYGYARQTSPSLEAIAADGVVFENAAAQAPWTMPSHFQMVTSRFTSGKSKVLEEGYTTAAERLRDEGYRTGAVLANFSLGRRSGFEQGFDTYVDGPVMVLYLKVFEKLPVTKALMALPFVPGDLVLRYLHRKTFLEGIAARADAMNEHALDFIDGRRGAPFFLFLNYMDAHDAYDPPRAYRDRFAHIDDPEIGFVRYSRRLGGTISSNQFVRDVVPVLSEDEWRRIVALYDAELAYLDDQVGRLMEGLKARGLYDRTIIVITADHGELMGEHGLANHFKSLSEEEIHVPLIVRYPPALRPARVTTPVQLMDVLPTLSELTGLPAGDTMEGQSLVPLLAGTRPADPEAPVFSYLIRSPERQFPHTAAGHLVAMRSGTRKFIWSSTGMHAYYDFAADPKADRNGYGDAPEVAALASRLDEWRKAVGLERLDGGGPIDRLTRERLRALGYVQ